jgi:hypothetical protein
MSVTVWNIETDETKELSSRETAEKFINQKDNWIIDEGKETEMNQEDDETTEITLDENPIDDDQGSPTDEKSGSSKGPVWQKKIWISDKRNIQLTVWPEKESSKYEGPSVTLEEGRKQDDGSWESNRIYMPTGAQLLVFSRYFEEAWEEAKKVRAEA